MEKFNHLKALIASIELDANKFYNKANKTSGTRVRKTLQEIKALASDIRKEVTEIKNKDKK